MNLDSPVLIVWLAQGLGLLLLAAIVYESMIRAFRVLQPPESRSQPIASFSPQNYNPLFCSIAVRQAPIAADCCLFQSHEGRSLKGGAIASRRYRLKRLGILL